MKPFFSIVTPTFNREKLLVGAITSVLAQTFKDWELIIMDDGSTDNTEAVVKRFLTDPRIKYHKKTNTGQSDSLNVGVGYAKADFITFLDSDDEAYPNWLEVVYNSIRPDTGMVCAGSVRKLSNGKRIEDNLRMMKWGKDRLRVKFTSGSLFIRKEIFQAVGGYDVHLKSNTQTDLGFRLLQHMQKTGLKIVPIDQHLIQVNIHQGARIRNNWQRVIEGSTQFLEKHYDLMCRNDKGEVSNYYVVIAFSNYKLKKRSEAVQSMAKAIKLNPAKVSHYLRFLKYALT